MFRKEKHQISPTPPPESSSSPHRQPPLPSIHHNKPREVLALPLSPPKTPRRTDSSSSFSTAVARLIDETWNGSQIVSEQTARRPSSQESDARPGYARRLPRVSPYLPPQQPHLPSRDSIVVNPAAAVHAPLPIPNMNSRSPPSRQASIASSHIGPLEQVAGVVNGSGMSAPVPLPDFDGRVDNDGQSVSLRKIFDSGIIKIILPDAYNEAEYEEQEEAESDPNKSLEDLSNCSGVSLYAHKGLIIPLSEELKARLHSPECEGGDMTLPGVDKATVEFFLEWAYRRIYPVCVCDPTTLILHARIYSLSNTFKVHQLTDLAYDKITTSLQALGEPCTPAVVGGVMQVFKHCFNHLPVTEYFTSLLAPDPTAVSDPPSPSSSPNPSGERSSLAASSALIKQSQSSTSQFLPHPHKLLGFLSAYAAWSLPMLRQSKDFRDLLLTQPSFTSAILFQLSPAACPPWQPPQSTPSPTIPTSTTTFSQPNIRVINDMNIKSNHILFRECTSINCGNYFDITIPQCIECSRKDPEVGIVVDIGTGRIVLGEERITGSKEEGGYWYECRWCAARNWYQLVNNYLYCRKCDTYGKHIRLVTE